MKKLQALVGVAVTLGLAAVARDAPPSPTSESGKRSNHWAEPQELTAIRSR